MGSYLCLVNVQGGSSVSGRINVVVGRWTGGRRKELLREGGKSVSLLQLAGAISVSLCGVLFLCCVGGINTPQQAHGVTV